MCGSKVEYKEAQVLHDVLLDFLFDVRWRSLAKQIYL